MAKPKKRVRRFKQERIEKMSAHDITRISEDRLRRATTKELFNLVNRAQSLFGKRLHAIYKANLGGFAYAANLKIDPTEMSGTPTTRYEAAHMLSMFREFFKSKTSTVQGIKKMIAKEEKRLSDLAGRDITFSSEDMRINFWSAYMEFLRTNPALDTRQNSERIQQILGEMKFWEERGFTADDLETALSNFNERFGS